MDESRAGFHHASASNLDLWRIPIAIAIIATLVFGKFRGRAFVIALVLGIGISDGVISDAIKKSVDRPRPYQVLANVRVVELKHIHPKILGPIALFKPLHIKYSRPETGLIHGRSFPSSHALNNFCVAMIFIGFYRRWGWLYLFPAALVSYSRMYTGSHWPSDVLISTFLGIGIGLLLLVLYEFLWRKFAPRLLPSLFARHPSLLNAR